MKTNKKEKAIIVNNEVFKKLNFQNRISELEKRVDELEKENKKKDELLRPLSIAVAFLCMFKKEELDEK